MGNTRGTIHKDKFLTNFSLKYKNGMFIADAVCPRVPVAKESDTYPQYGRQSFQTSEDQRADKADVNFIDSFKIDSTPTYTCEEHSLADLVSDRERNNADEPIAPDLDATEGLTQRLMLNREARVASLYTTTGNWANEVTLSGTQQFNNASYDSDSVTDAIEVRIDTGKEAIRSAIGMEPNAIIIPAAVAKVIKRDVTIRDLIKHTHNDLLVNGDLPPTLWNMKVYIPGGIKNSDEEGQTFSGTDVWGKHIVLLFLAPNPRSKRTMTSGLTFQSQARQTMKWREDMKKSDAIEVSEIVTEKIVNTNAGYVIINAIA